MIRFISEILLKGSSNAQSGRSICEFLNISPRELTQRVERERRGGSPICAVSGRNPGYYLAETQEEMQDYCRRLHHRERELSRTRVACIRTSRMLPERGGKL